MKVPSILRRSLAALPLAAAAAALAHPGHDSAPQPSWFDGPAHLLAQPDLAALWGGALLAALVARRVWRSRARRGRGA